jgi:hypothetical protein
VGTSAAEQQAEREGRHRPRQAGRALHVGRLHAPSDKIQNRDPGGCTILAPPRSGIASRKLRLTRRPVEVVKWVVGAVLDAAWQIAE